MTRWDAVILTLVVVLPGLFAVYEMAALNGLFGLHTISWYAQHSFALDLAIVALVVIAAVVFLLWWRRHMKSRIPR